MEGRCERHTFEAAEAICRACGYEFCHECLVYTHGAKRPPYCVQCAVAAAGVRSTAGHAPRASAKEIKKDIRARKRSGPREPMAGGPVSLNWDIPDDDPFEDAVDSSEEAHAPEKRTRLKSRKRKKEEEAAAAAADADPFGDVPPLPDEPVAELEPERPALVDPSSVRDLEIPTAEPAAAPAPPAAALPTEAPPPLAPPAPRPAPPVLPTGQPAPLVIDELEPEPFDIMEPVLPRRQVQATDAGGTPIPSTPPQTPFDLPATGAPAADPWPAAGPPPAAPAPPPIAAPSPAPPAPPAPPSMPMSAPVQPNTPPPPRLPEPVSSAHLFDPLAPQHHLEPPVAASASPVAPQPVAPPPTAEDPFAPRPVVGPRIGDDGAAPAPFPGPRADDGLPQRTPGAQHPAGADPRPAMPSQPAPPAAAAASYPAPPAPPAAPVQHAAPVAQPPWPAPAPAPAPPPAPVHAAAPPAAPPPAPPVAAPPERNKGFRRLMPSSVRSKVEDRRSVPVQDEPPDLSSFPGLGPIGPPRSERPLKTLAEMRPDEIDAALPDVSDLYDRVSDQNATTL